jgi:metal-dependent HD superfamily phosphatase/phosphodiesterase
MPMADIRKTLASTAIRRVRLRENEKTPVITL